MNPTVQAIADSLGTGLPVLLLHLLTTLALLGLGATCYVRLTPFKESALIAAGNNAAGLVFAGAMISLAIPLAVTLATTHIWLDIVLWGIVAIVLQLITFIAVALLFRHLRESIEQGNFAAALALIGIQIAVSLLNAGAMAG